MKINEIMELLNNIAPFASAEEWDNSGLIVNSGREIKKIGITLDITNDSVSYAAEEGIDLIISHHPVIFNPVSSVSFQSPFYSLIQNGISAIACHTNFDNSGRLNHALADKLGLSFKKNIENGWGIICSLAEPTDTKSFAEKVKKALNTEGLSYAGNKNIKNIAVTSGSAFEDVYRALAEGADGILTSDVKHSGFIDALNMGFSVISADHYDTEKLFCEILCKLLADADIAAEIAIIPQNSPQRHL